MNRENLIVDMQSPTPLDVYRFSSKGCVDILFYKVGASKYTIEIKDASKDDVVLDSVCNNLVQLWTIVEVIRAKAYRKSKTVDVYDVDAKTRYKKITLATTLDKQEREEARERQIKRIKNTRRRMLVDNKYHSRKRKKVSPRVLRPILREEKTW